MSWSERQRRMLEAMGLKIWVAPDVGVTPVAAPQEDGRVAAEEASAAVAVAERPRAPVSARVADRAAPGAAAVTGALDAVQPASKAPSEPLSPPTSKPVLERPSGPTAQRAADVLSRALPANAAAALAASGDAAPGAVPQRTGLSREAIAALDWDGLRSAVADCRACSLCETRKNTVFGVGHSQAHWMIIGEAPGEQEDLQGEPFVGPAGKLLDNMLRALGLSRTEGPPEQQVFIANTLKCRPPRNRNPDPSELTQCEPFLQRQIELIQPRIILAMGRFAVQQLLQSQEAIGRLRGRVHRYQGVPLVVTYHPAYLLRNLPDKARAWEDLCLARQTLESGG